MADWQTGRRCGGVEWSQETSLVADRWGQRRWLRDTVAMLVVRRVAVRRGELLGEDDGEDGVGCKEGTGRRTEGGYGGNN